MEVFIMSCLRRESHTAFLPSHLHPSPVISPEKCPQGWQCVASTFSVESDWFSFHFNQYGPFQSQEKSCIRWKERKGRTPWEWQLTGCSHLPKIWPTGWETCRGVLLMAFSWVCWNPPLGSLWDKSIQLCWAWVKERDGERRHCPQKKEGENSPTPNTGNSTRK